MGFFKDFKRDFAQAVNELMPDKDELANEYDDEDIVNTFDEEDNMEIAPEDMLEDLDDFSIDSDDFGSRIRDEEPVDEKQYEDDGDDEAFSNIPNAEIINEPVEATGEFEDIQTEYPDAVMAELTVVEEKEDEEETDELVEADMLDEADMEENLSDALSIEPEEDKKESFLSVDLNQAVSDAISRHDEDINEEDNMAEVNSTETIDKTTVVMEQEQDGLLSQDTTYITKSTTIKGDIDTDGGIDVIGTVEGNVSCTGKLIVGGAIKGNVSAGEIYSNAAKIEGEITSVGSVKIGVGSVVVGNVKATTAVIAGAVNGDIDVDGPVIVDSTAVIMGNIKSRSVQINNGAVIEGFCSQSYSEIDVKSFFE